MCNTPRWGTPGPREASCSNLGKRTKNKKRLEWGGQQWTGWERQQIGEEEPVLRVMSLLCTVLELFAPLGLNREENVETIWLSINLLTPELYVLKILWGPLLTLGSQILAKLQEGHGSIVTDRYLLYSSVPGRPQHTCFNKPVDIQRHWLLLNKGRQAEGRGTDHDCLLFSQSFTLGLLLRLRAWTEVGCCLDQQ